MKRIVYDYSFNYFGGEKFGGRVVNGASVSLNIRAYKGGKEVLFEDGDEAKAYDNYLNDVYDVFFDRDKLFIVKKNLVVDNLFRLTYGWDRIEYQVAGYSLDVVCGTIGDEENELPDFMQNLPVAEPVSLSEEQWRSFLSSHKDDFDILDNKNAQVPSVAFIDPEKDEAAS